MDFDLTENQILLRDTVRRFVNERVKSGARAWDDAGAIPDAVFGELAAIGLMGMTAEPELDGAGLGAIELALVVEEIARGDGALALSVAHHNALCATAISRYGTAVQKDRYLRPLARGDSLGGSTLAEEAGDAPAGIIARAVPDADTWLVDGTLRSVTHGTRGDIFLLVAATSDAQELTTFVVEKGTAGLEQRPAGETLGMRAADRGTLMVTGARIPDSNRLGARGEAVEQRRELLDLGRILLGALAVGIGRGAVDAARAYALERKQFGKPIAEFQAIQWKLADSATELDAASLLVLRAACSAAAGVPVERQAAMAKLFASEAAMRASDHAVQIHGGFGFTSAFPVERSYRDVKLCALSHGTSAHQRALIAQHLLEA